MSLTEQVESRLTTREPRRIPHGLTRSRMRQPSGRRTRPSFKMFTHVVLISVCLLAVAPFAWMVSTSLKTADNAILYPPQILPKPVVPHNYWEVINGEKTSFLLWTRNSMIVALLTVAGDDAVQRRRRLRFCQDSVSRPRRAVRHHAGDDDDSFSRHDGAAVQHLPMDGRCDGNRTGSAHSNRFGCRPGSDPRSAFSFSGNSS